MVAEVVDGMLRSHSGADRRREFDALVAIVLSVFDRYPFPPRWERPPGASCASIWSAACSLSACIRPKRAMDIPEPFAKLYFDLMPIHEKLARPATIPPRTIISR